MVIINADKCKSFSFLKDLGVENYIYKGGKLIIKDNISNDIIEKIKNYISNFDEITFLKQQLLSYYDNYNRQIIEKHYPLLKLQGFMQISITLQMKLNDPSLTDEEKQAIQSKLAKIQSVNDWIHNCTAIYYKYEQLFSQATTFKEIESLKEQIEQEYKNIEQQDPKITYKDLI